MYYLIVWSEMIISMSQSNACNYQMYEIDNGINQSKCQNSSPIYALFNVGCLAAIPYD